MLLEEGFDTEKMRKMLLSYSSMIPNLVIGIIEVHDEMEIDN